MAFKGKVSRAAAVVKRIAKSAFQRPAAAAHAAIHSRFDKSATEALRKRAGKLPLWFTADNVTTFRTGILLPPVLIAYAQGGVFVPVTGIVANAALDFVDGVVARWERTDPDRVALLKRSNPVNEGNEAVLSSRAVNAKETWGAYYDAIADKVFFLPLWMCMFQSSAGEPVLQSALLAAAAIETCSCYVRTKAYFSEPVAEALPAAAEASQIDVKSGATVVAEAVGKVKFFVAACGTALAIVPATHMVGAALLWTSVPLAAASLARKLRGATVYAEVSELKRSDFEFLERAAATGSRLIVGVRGDDDDVLAALHYAAFVDAVVRVPEVPSSSFYEAHSVDLVADLREALCDQSANARM